MKLDKDTLIKQKFWVILCAVVPVTLITLLLIVTFVSGSNSSRERNLKKSVTAPGGQVPSSKDIEELEKSAKAEADKRGSFWEKAWKRQEHIFTWPEEFDKSFPFNGGYFATDVKVSKGAPAAAAAAGSDRFFGTLKKVDKQVDQDGEFFEVDSADKKTSRKFHRAQGLTISEDGKKLSWNDLAVGKAVEVTFHRHRSFYDLLTDREKAKYVEVYKTGKAVRDIFMQVDPAVEGNEGVVLLGNTPLKRGTNGAPMLPPSTAEKPLPYLRFVPKWNDSLDISEEVWLAQEDLWIQKELYLRIKLANDSVSIMSPVEYEGDDGKPVTVTDGKIKAVVKGKTSDVPVDFKELNAKNPRRKFTFQNLYWSLELELQKDQSVNYRIENRLPRRQKLLVDFRLNDEEDPVPIQGVALDPRPLSLKDKKDPKDDDPDIKYFQVGTIKPPVPPDKAKDPKKKAVRRTGIFSVKQVLTTDTAAVKGIDLVVIGSVTTDECAQSHRRFPDKQIAFKEEKRAPEPAAKDPGLDPRKAEDKARTENKLIRERYLAPAGGKVVEEMRRVPVAIVLIVDQEQIDRVLTSFRNSPLRFLTTQVILNRKVQLAGQSGPLPVQPRQPEFRPPPFKGLDLQPPPPQAGPEPQPQALEANVELIIYGEVTLYNRYRASAASK